MEGPTVSPATWLLLAGMAALLGVTATAAVMFTLRQHARLVAQFRQLGEKFGLEITIPEATIGGLYRRSPTLYGRYRGHEMSIFPKGYGLDNTRQTDIAVCITTRAAADFEFTLAPRNFTGKLGQIGLGCQSSPFSPDSCPMLILPVRMDALTVPVLRLAETPHPIGKIALRMAPSLGYDWTLCAIA